MNELFYNLIIIIVIVVLFLAYILIAYFYNSYINHKSDVKTNFKETTSYINTTTTKIDNNINTRSSAINARVDAVDTKYRDINIDFSNRLASNNVRITGLDNSITSNSSNLNNFDSGIKQFIEFRDNNNNINDYLFKYRFSAVPNLSMNLIRNVSAISGMTIKTNDTNNKFRICDTNIGESNCIDLRVHKGTFDIMPSAIKDNNVSNINFYGMNNKVLANFNLESNNIYLGGAGENAGLFINENNIYMKNFNLIDANTKFTDKKVLYDKTLKGTTQTFNTYNYSFDDISRNTNNFVSGIYTIIKGVAGGSGVSAYNSVVINFKSNNNIPTGKQITIEIPELSNLEMNITLSNTEASSIAQISSIILNANKIVLTTGIVINANTNVRVKVQDVKLTIPATYTEAYISNMIMTKI
jgi:hypothetical protein